MYQTPADPHLLPKVVAGPLKSKEDESTAPFLHPGTILPGDTMSTGNNSPARIASSLQRQSQPGQAAGAIVTLFGGSRAPGRDIGAGKLIRELRALQKGTYFKQNIYNMIQQQ